MVAVAVAQNQERHVVGDRRVRLGTQLLNTQRQRRSASSGRVQAAEASRRGSIILRGQVQNLAQLVVVNNRKRDNDLTCVIHGGVEKVALRSETATHAGHDFFANGIEGRVRHLSKLLSEVVKQQPRLVGQNSDRRIRSHGPEGFLTGASHGRQHDAKVFFGVAKRALAARDGRCRMHNVFPGRQVGKIDASLGQPFRPRTGMGQFGLDLFVINDAAGLGVDKEHLARLKSALADDLRGVDLVDTDFTGDDNEPVFGDQVTSRT